MSDRPLRQAMKRVAVTLKAAQVPFALAGGYASWARGGPEPDHDADFILMATDVERAVQACQRAGLRVERPPEDWLAKVWDDSCDPPALVDLIHAPAQRPVSRSELERATEVEVDSVVMPVMAASDFLATRLLTLSEHACDFGRLFPHVRALREQVDWPDVREQVAGSPFAEAFLGLCERLGLVDGASR